MLDLVCVIKLTFSVSFPFLVSFGSHLVNWDMLEMYLVEIKEGAMACMLAALVLLGTWPAILALLERRVHLSQHTYLGYSLTNFLTAVIIALTNGQIGEAKLFSTFSVTEVIKSSIAVLLGVGCFLIAVCLGAAVHSSNSADKTVKTRNLAKFWQR